MNRPPDAVERARDAEERYRAETERQWEAKLDALEATRTPVRLVNECAYCWRDNCRCVDHWRADARRCGDEFWDA